MQIRARNHWVLLDATDHVKSEYETESGLIIKRKLKQQVMDELEMGAQFREAVVVAVGDQVREIEPGDTVILDNKRGNIKGRLIDGESTFVWVKDTGILGVVEED